MRESQSQAISGSEYLVSSRSPNQKYGELLGPYTSPCSARFHGLQVLAVAEGLAL